MASHEPEAAVETGSASSSGRDQLEEEVHELQDHEFTLELDDTVEIERVAPALQRALPPEPPLPRWAAASRALLDGWQKLLEVNAQATIEVPPADAASGTAGVAARDANEPSKRNERAQLAVQLHAREVYCREIERALVAASGKVRGQAFRIAELEYELRELRALKHDPAATLPPLPTRPSLPSRPALPSTPERPRTTTVVVARDDLKRIRGIGPRFEQRLFALGVTSFASIANWSATDITSIAQQLGVQRDRLTHDSWVKQARALAKPARASKARSATRSKTR